MGSLFDSYEKTIREVGFFALKALMWLNALALLSVWTRELKQAGIWAATAPHFLFGIITAFAALLVTYAAAQVAISGRHLAASWFVFMIATPALSLFFFARGVILTFPLMGGL